MECQNCREQNAPRNRFCFNRGIPLYAKPLMEPQGERKQATVLFADIVGSTELIANLDAELASRRIQPAVEAMTQVVRRFGGNVLHTLGDGLDAIFGAPRADDGHAIFCMPSSAGHAGNNGIVANSNADRDRTPFRRGCDLPARIRPRAGSPGHHPAHRQPAGTRGRSRRNSFEYRMQCPGKRLLRDISGGSSPSKGRARSDRGVSANRRRRIRPPQFSKWARSLR